MTCEPKPWLPKPIWLLPIIAIAGCSRCMQMSFSKFQKRTSITCYPILRRMLVRLPTTLVWKSTKLSSISTSSCIASIIRLFLKILRNNSSLLSKPFSALGITHAPKSIASSIRFQKIWEPPLIFKSWSLATLIKKVELESSSLEIQQLVKKASLANFF